MAESSAPDEQGKTKQLPQGNWMQPLQPQLPFHSLGGGGSYAPGAPFVPFQGASAQVDSMNTKNTVVLGNLSLLAISFSLVLLGAFTFLGGFLLGMWVAASPKIPLAADMNNVPALGLPPSPQHMSVPQTALGGEMLQNLSRNLSQNVGSATQGAITGFTIPGVPDSLTPYVATQQSVFGRQAGSKVQEQVSRYARPPSSSKVKPLNPKPSSSSTSREITSPYEAPLPQTPQRDASALSVSPLHKGALPTSASLSPPKLPFQEDEEIYTVQLGVYAAKDNAQALINHLQALNYTSHIVEGKNPEGNTVYYVHSGLYKDYNTAVDAASQFGGQNIPGAIVVKTSTRNKNTL